jgi:hypothetical protein
MKKLLLLVICAAVLAGAAILSIPVLAQKALHRTGLITT